jgi:outer membrane immunogenic protein
MLVCANGVFAASAALAADLGGYSVKDDRHLGPGAKWTGLYIGVHGGYAWGQWDGKLEHDPGLGPLDIFNSKPGRIHDAEGFLGGVQLGIDKQFGSVVVGLVVDGTWGDLKGSGKHDIDGDGNTVVDYTWDIEQKIDALGTARARLGLLLKPNLLAYATGGLAFARTSGDLTVTCHEPQGGAFAPLTTARGSASENHLGWTIGGGLEMQVGGGWSLSAEYLYINLGSADYRLKGTAYPDGPSPPFPAPSPHTTDSFKSDLDLHVAKVGLNYKF